ncbi:MAG: UPF0182 family protein [Bacillota bacterium]
MSNEPIDFESILNKIKNSSSKSRESVPEFDFDSFLPKIKKIGFWILLIAIVFFVVGSASKIFFRVTQLNEIGGYESIFYTNLKYMIISASICGLITFVSILISNIFAKMGIKKIMKNLSIVDVEGKTVKKIPNFLFAFIGAFMTVVVTQTAFYKDIMLFLNSGSFNVNTPITNVDVGYYIFQRPLLLGINNYLIAFLSFLLIYTIGYYIFAFLKIFKDNPRDVFTSASFLRHVAIIGALLLISICFIFKFQLDGLVYGEFIGVTGIGYIQNLIWKPFFTYFPFLFFALIVLAIILIWKHKIKATVITITILPVILILVSITSAFIQGFIVKPNEPNFESEFLKNNMSMTRSAFNFDKLQVSDFSKTNPVTKKIIDANKNTYNNIRIVDYSSTLKNNSQLQVIRNFYTFLNGDIINYDIKGKETPVFISAREISKDNVIGNNSYVGKVFQYTHGYGVVVNPINKITSQGQPDILLGELTMENKGNKSLTVTQPRIYYGENTNDYSIVNPSSSNKLKETDFIGDTNYSFEGNSGIKLNLFNKLMYAINYNDFNMFISSNIDDNSMLLLNRNIVARAQMAFPFLSIDKDPYIVIDEDGGLKWILDAYTSTDLYPYANKFGTVNYTRNSVKIVIDAYSGKVKAYAIDKIDPILKAYMNIYPNVISSDELPKFVTSHMRYPEALFKLQTEAIKKYHLDPLNNEDVNAFYQKQDFWNIAKYSKSEGEPNIDIEPYYNMIQLPILSSDKSKNAKNSEELILMRPFTPSSVDDSRHNMVAWMAARNSAENYGELVLYKFSKNSNILGPDQIAVNINQNPELSKTKTLWNKEGSKVMMGDLLVVPIQDTILYVQSMYLESASQSSIPQVKIIIVGYQNGDGFVLGFGSTLDLAMKDLYAKDTTTEPVPTDPNPSTSPSPSPGIGQPTPAPDTTKGLTAEERAKIKEYIAEIQKILDKNP